VPLRKSDRPHMFALAFSLDTQRQLRRSPSTDTELIWSTVKLRNCSTDRGSSSRSSTSRSSSRSSSGDDGALRFRVPADPLKPTTLHVLLASNYLGSSGSSSSSGTGSGSSSNSCSTGGVPYRVVVRSPDGERRAPELLKHPTGLTSDESTDCYNFDSKHDNRVASHRSSSSSGSSSSGGLVEAASLPTRILCVDGGGSKGVIPLESLAEVRNRTVVHFTHFLHLLYQHESIILNRVQPSCLSPLYSRLHWSSHLAECMHTCWRACAKNERSAIYVKNERCVCV